MKVIRGQIYKIIAYNGKKSCYFFVKNVSFCSFNKVYALKRLLCRGIFVLSRWIYKIFSQSFNKL